MTPGEARASGPDFPRLHVITDDRILASPDFGAQAREILSAGGNRIALHLRGRRTTGRALFDRTAALVRSASESGALLIVNDRIDVAIAAGADGVQLGGGGLRARDIPQTSALQLGIGVSVHSEDEASEAGPADWLLAGTLWPTRSHPGRAGSGAGHVTRIRTARSDLPVIGIGGVTLERVEAVLRAGAHGVAALSSIWDASDPVTAVDHYLQVLAQARLTQS